jgi:hypothetical protein
MVRRNPRLQRNVTEKNFRSLIFAAHRSALSTGGSECTESLKYGITPSR